MKNIVITLLAVFCMQGLSAQKGGTFIVSYPISFPFGDLQEYNNQPSFSGISLEYLKSVKSGLGVGVEVGWHLFHQKENEKTYTEGTQSITGTQFRYTNAVPLLAQAKFFKSTTGSMMPYAGLGVGTLYVNRSTDFGLYRFTNETWQFCLRPEVGVVFRSSKNPGIGGMIGVKYYAGFGTDDLDAQSYLSINIGFVATSGY